MMAQLPITPPRNDRSVPTDGQADSLNLVAVVSESPHEAIGRLASTVSVRLRGFANDSRRVRYTRVAAHTVGGSAAWLLRRTGKTGLCAMTAGLFGMAPEELSDLPRDVPAIMNLLLREESSGLDHRAVATAIAAPQDGRCRYRRPTVCRRRERARPGPTPGGPGLPGVSSLCDHLGNRSFTQASPRCPACLVHCIQPGRASTGPRFMRTAGGTAPGGDRIGSRDFNHG